MTRNEGEKPPVALRAEEAPLRARPSTYPEPFFSRMSKRAKRPLGDLFGLTNFAVNLTTLAPGGESALLHRHSKQDEFVYILDGEPTLVTDVGEIVLSPGMCAGFRAGSSDGHQLINRGDRPARYLEVSNRDPEDTAAYPDVDMAYRKDAGGRATFTRKDGSPY